MSALKIFFIRGGIVLATMVIMIATVLAIVAFHGFKFFGRLTGQHRQS